MAQLQRAEGQTEMKCQAHKFFDVWAHKAYLVSEICPHKIPMIELHEGKDWGSVGAVKTWHFNAGDGLEFVKTRVAEKDECKRSVRYDYIDGQIFQKYYKIENFKSQIQTIPKGEGCIVKWSFEYEKIKEDAPDASIYIEFLLSCAKDMDARLCNA